MRIGLGKYTLATSPPGEISEKGCWAFVELSDANGWLYTNHTFWGLLKQLITEWRNDKYIVGY